jgi:hypothetical protein
MRQKHDSKPQKTDESIKSVDGRKPGENGAVQACGVLPATA